MGGRGGASKVGGGGAKPQQAQQPQPQQKSNAPGGWDDNGNPALVKYQNQTDDKTANFLAKVHRDTDLNQIQKQTNDPYGFYDNDFQRLVLQLGLNGKPQTMSAKQFDAYVKNNRSEVLYRGVSGQDAVDRFNNSPNNHTGNGVYGEGHYFSPDKSTAQQYARMAGGSKSKIITATLDKSKARVVDVNTVRAEIQKHNSRLRASLRNAGSAGTRSYGSNKGEAQMALKMGYNAINVPGFAVIPLVRDIVIVRGK